MFRLVAVSSALFAAGVSATSSEELIDLMVQEDMRSADKMVKEGERQEETFGQHLREFSELVVGVMDNVQVAPAPEKGAAEKVAAVVKKPAAEKQKATVSVAEKPAEQKAIKPVTEKPAEKKAIKPVSTKKEDAKAAPVPTVDKDVEKVRADVKKLVLKNKNKHPSHFEFPPELQKLNEQFKKPISHVFGGNGPDAKLQQLTIMVPMLESMYDKFKDDIKANNKLEKQSASRLKQYTDELAEIKKTGKNKYLLEEKERAFKYFKKQREIQHRHYHAMLKMAHASMERLNKVKKMVKVAEKTGKVEKSDMEALGAMLPGGLTV